MNMLWLLFLLMTSLSSQAKYIDEEAGKQSLCVFIPRGPGLEVCFIEIGPLGSSITQADRDRLATAITDATNNTALPAFPKAQPSPRQYVYGSYVDEPLLLKAGANRYYYATNRLYSVAALTSQLGQVVERYLYDAYGRQTVLASNGVVAYKPSDYGQFVGFTGRYHDWETGLEYFRARYYDLVLGRFISRNPGGYLDGWSLYLAQMGMQGMLDPTGLPGQHYVPQSIFRNRGFPSGVVNVFNAGTTGTTINHGYGAAHEVYNAIIDKQLNGFMSKNGISAAEMTPELDIAGRPAIRAIGIRKFSVTSGL